MGKLYLNDLNRYKQWFKESAKLLGITIQYRYIINRSTEIATGESVYSKLSEPIELDVVIETGLPKVNSLKQLGWFVDTEEEELLVDFAVDTPNLQEGCRIKLASNENTNQQKEYVVKKLSSEELYPSCIKCLCVPILVDESTVSSNSDISYGEQSITSDDENYTFINESPQITVF